MSERLDRIETEIERILGVQRDLQESQLRFQESLAEIRDATAQNAETTARNAEAITQLVRIVTVQQDSLEGMNRRIDGLSGHDGEEPEGE